MADKTFQQIREELDAQKEQPVVEETPKPKKGAAK